jgi:EAL domain-containing protein (putative c-di-GMP-specific phosphodiesterase class I)/PAS domain-containing protein
VQDPLRVVFVEQRQADHEIVAQLLRDHHLDFSSQYVASAHELSQIAAKFHPHIVLCSDDIAANSNHGLVETLRLLCSQTPVILLSSICEAEPAPACESAAALLKIKRQSPEKEYIRSTAETGSTRDAQNAADLRKAFSAVLESSAEPAVISNADGWISYANTSACLLLDALCERSLVTVLSATKDQCSPMPHWLAVSDAINQDRNPDFSVGGSTSSGVDSERSLHRLAYFDSWSLLPRLVHIDDLIGCLTARQREYSAAVALIAMDLDSARLPDEVCNRAQDEELPAPAGCDVQTTVVRYGSIVRIAPDDFLLVLPDPSRPADAAVTVQRILDSIAKHPSNLGECNSGWQRRHAPQLHASADGRPVEARLVAEFGDAMQRHALSVHYQPQFDIETGRGCGVEALARWVLCSGESIAPSVFIPIAERSGIIHSLGAWMLKSACETAYAWCSRDAQRTTLSVNVSALQIDEEFCAVLGRTLEKSGFPAKQLELEIAESALIANPDLTIDCLKEWKKLGVRIAMDDFGTDCSSLSYLSRLPVDRLKLDQSLIHRMTLDSKSAEVARLIVSLGSELGIDVIAKGVETEQQLKMLTDLGCPRAQGYLLGRPMPAKQAQLALRKVWGNRVMPIPPPSRNVMAYSHA